MQIQSVGVDMPSKQAMAKLAQAAQRLNRVSDKMNESIEAFEDELSKLGIGITFWYGADRTNLHDFLVDRSDRDRVVLDDERTEVGGFSGWLLGYAKVDGKWRVAAKRVELIEDRENFGGGSAYVVYRAERPLALVKAPRSVRVSSAGELEGLVKALTKQLDEYSKNIESTQALLGGEDDDAGTLRAK